MQTTKGEMTMSRKASKPFDFSGLHELLKDPEQAGLYLEECYIDGDMELFQEALRHVAKAQKGGVKAVAEAAGLNRTNLYRSLAKGGKPNSETISKFVDALGYKMKVSFEPKQQVNA